MIEPQSNGKTDEVYTPNYAINPLLPYIKKEWVVFECAYGAGHLAESMRSRGLTVVGNANVDFLKRGIVGFENCDCIVTNPPYSLKTKFLKKCYEVGKPFALLLPLTALEGKKRNALYRENGVEVIIPDRRIHFIMTDTRMGKKSSSWFQTAWFTHGFGVTPQLCFVEGDW